MSTSQPRLKAPAVFPVLMRLPDLRPAPPVPAEPVPAAPVIEAAVTVVEAAAIAIAAPELEVVEQPQEALAPVVTSATPEPQAAPDPAVDIVAAAPPAEIGVEVASPTAIEQQSEPQAAPATSTATDHVSPAEARRARARERQRQLAVREKPKASWWTSHGPVIAGGFLMALMLTIFLARRNRHSAGPPAASREPMVPEVVIDNGPAQSAPATENDVPAAPAVVASAVPEPMSKRALPPLLSTKPQTAQPEADISTTSATEAEPEPESDYPTTDPQVHRPGGRPPRAVRAARPTDPSNSNPNYR